MEFLSQNYVTLTLIASLLITFFVSPLAIKWCTKVFGLDAAVKRNHTEPTPTGGGLLFVPIIFAMLIFFTFSDYSDLTVSMFLLAMSLGSLAIAGTGFLDDRKHLNPKIRLTVQFLATVLPVLLLPDVWIGITDWIEKPILILSWMWFVNVYNFLDGTDGNAAVESIVIGIVGTVLMPAMGLLFMAIVFPMLGFLRVNFPRPRNRLFMGDLGSTFLGYVLGGIMFAAISFESSLSFSFFTLVMLFSCDATYTLAKRIIRREKPLMIGHKEHWIARMCALEFSHLKILTLGALVNIVLIIIIAFTYDNNMRFASPFLGILAFSALAYYIKYCEKKAGIKPLGFKKQK